jgi:hypothetical protein
LHAPSVQLAPSGQSSRPSHTCDAPAGERSADRAAVGVEVEVRVLDATLARPGTPLGLEWDLPPEGHCDDPGSIAGPHGGRIDPGATSHSDDLPSE